MPGTLPVRRQVIRGLRRRWRNRGVPHNHPFTEVEPTGLDYRGLPTAECLCGGRTFYAVVWFDDNYQVAGYITDGLCPSCGALVTLCTEIDHPTYEED